MEDIKDKEKLLKILTKPFYLGSKKEANEIRRKSIQKDIELKIDFAEAMKEKEVINDESEAMLSLTETELFNEKLKMIYLYGNNKENLNHDKWLRNELAKCQVNKIPFVGLIMEFITNNDVKKLRSYGYRYIENIRTLKEALSEDTGTG